MSLARKVFAAPARIWINWPLWGGLLAMLLLAKHAWVLFAPSEHAVPSTTTTTQAAQTEQLFGSVNTAASTASLGGIRAIGIFASRNNGFAVMQTETGQIGVGLGGQIVPGVRLVETHSDYVILERDGSRQRVDLSKAPAAGGAAPVHVASPVHGDPIADAQAQALNKLSPEQRKILQLQQQELIRGKH
ncbi:type II secretion system protein N [Sideroxydans sp. CL21]|uniref:type II secretion system protein N n=1 Tax=Sideroxydans sp. CL21 TaxID=2600596 RepID=UPI0024BBF499|nr:type II secretion system protein N [Sideroxydans sp. CL21]